MDGKPRTRTNFFNRIFSLMSLLGLLISVIGIGLDLIPGSSPGVSIPQLMMISGGVLVFLIGVVLRRASVRRWIVQDLARNLLISLVITSVTLICLEIVLGVADVKTRYPAFVPESFLQAVPWWTCDNAGCHYVYEQMMIACENKEVSGRRCMLNQQGFHDSQDFVWQDEYEDKLRIVMLGDSFTFGGTAAVGHSFVETVETNLPDAIVWNTGIPGAGTNQAVDTLKAFAPILKPQIAILGFYMNDFEDNMFPLDSYFMGVDSTQYPLAIRQYIVDNLGRVTKLGTQAELYYRYNQVNPPSSEFERIAGTTRLGSLLLNTLETIAHVIDKADGRLVNEQVAVTRTLLTQLRDYANDNTIELFILVIPRREDIGSPGTLYLNAIRLFDELAIPYLDPIDVLYAEWDYARDPDVHWSTTGHQKAGNLITACLEQYLANGMLSDCESLTVP